MLHELRISGLGVIDDAVLPLHPGLTVLTGETGAGKTMVVHGLGLLLGSRADAGLVRAGTSRTSVEGILDLPRGHPARARAEEAGADLDGDELVLARTVTAEGRSRAVVGGRTVPVGVLAELGETLVAVHGQADQWRLRRPEQHRELLDGYGGAPLAAARAAYEQAYAGWLAVRAERDELRALERDRTREADAARAALELIERVDPQPGEDVAVRAEDTRLAHAETLRAAAQQAHALLTGPELDDSADPGAGAAELLSRARTALAAAVRHDPRAQELDTRVADAAFAVGDLAADLARYLDDLEVDPARLAWVQQRRADLGALTRRYGDTIDEVLAWARDASARLDLLVGLDERLAGLELELERSTGELADAARALTQARRAAASAFEEAVAGELAHLAMGAARVHVHLTDRDPGPHGGDDVEIQLAPTAGSPPRSVARAASGGELSRLMLAIEVITAGPRRPGPVPGQIAADAAAPPPTFVFDEVDAGVGGRAALDVGARLTRLSRHAQVVVVTHLAQVAAHADRHLVVHKSVDGMVTASTVHEVDGDERLSELSRMMGGADSPAGLEHARALIDRVRRGTRAASARGSRRHTGSAGDPADPTLAAQAPVRPPRRAGLRARASGRGPDVA